MKLYVASEGRESAAEYQRFPQGTLKLHCNIPVSHFNEEFTGWTLSVSVLFYLVSMCRKFIMIKTLLLKSERLGFMAGYYVSVFDTLAHNHSGK